MSGLFSKIYMWFICKTTILETYEKSNDYNFWKSEFKFMINNLINTNTKVFFYNCLYDGAINEQIK